ncbi:MAG TPA: hypothetical protein VM408_08275 [Methylomirabilota bacterium]|nr:hypothetical protein [Methylomirabilota bacterium]
MPVRRLRGATSIALLAFSLTACGGSTPSAAATATPAVQATPAPASVAPASVAPASSSPAASAGVPGASLATTGRIEVADKGFALTLPDGWTRINVGEGDIKAMLEAAGNLDPAFADQYAAQIQAMAASGLSVFALGPDPTAGTTLNVLALPGMGMSLDLLEQINTAQLEALAGTGVKAERVTLPAGEALHYRYELTKGVPTGTSVDQYLVLAGENQLVISVSNATEADAKAIAESVETLD